MSLNIEISQNMGFNFIFDTVNGIQNQWFWPREYQAYKHWKALRELWDSSFRTRTGFEAWLRDLRFMLRFLASAYPIPKPKSQPCPQRLPLSSPRRLPFPFACPSLHGLLSCLKPRLRSSSPTPTLFVSDSSDLNRDWTNHTKHIFTDPLQPPL